MTTTTTPRPWQVVEGEYIEVMDSGCARTIAQMTTYKLDKHKQKKNAVIRADAHLIVRAVNEHEALVLAKRVCGQRIAMLEGIRGDLLAALEELMSRFERTGEPWMSDPAMVTARAAIAKAEERATLIAATHQM